MVTGVLGPLRVIVNCCAVVVFAATVKFAGFGEYVMVVDPAAAIVSDTGTCTVFAVFPTCCSVIDPVYVWTLVNREGFAVTWTVCEFPVGADAVNQPVGPFPGFVDET